VVRKGAEINGTNIQPAPIRQQTSKTREINSYLFYLGISKENVSSLSTSHHLMRFKRNIRNNTMIAIATVTTTTNIEPGYVSLRTRKAHQDTREVILRIKNGSAVVLLL